MVGSGSGADGDTNYQFFITKMGKRCDSTPYTLKMAARPLNTGSPKDDLIKKKGRELMVLS